MDIFLKKKWSLKLSFLKIGFPSSIVYFLITTITFFSFLKNQFWAFRQMGFAPSKFQQNQSLKFFKLLGTGGGKGFSLWPDFNTSRYSLALKNYESRKRRFVIGFNGEIY